MNKFFLVGIILLAGCTYKDTTEKVYKVGFSQCLMYDDWRQAMYNEMQREVFFHEDMELIFRDAQSQNELQIQQIKELIDLDIDLLIVSPNEAEPLREVVEMAFDAGVPVVMLDRKVNSEKYTAYVGADNERIGEEAGKYVARLLNGKGRVLEAYEYKSITAFYERSEGFRKAIAPYPGIVLDTAQAMGPGVEQYRQLIDSLDYDVVFAHTDVAARFAFDVAREMDEEPHTKFIGIDGLPGENGGLTLVERGILDASLLYPTGGDVAIKVAADILHGRPFQRDNMLQTTIIDSTNVSVMQIQSQKLIQQQEDIHKLAAQIEVLIGVFRNQRNLTYLFAITMIASIVLAAYSFKSLVEKRRTYEELKYLNDQYVEMSKKAEEATQARFNFFTNISHEFRTPLTLINAPVDDLLAKREASFFKNDLLLIKKNTMRLLRLVNQLMDFRKIDSARMKVRAAEHNLVPFVDEIMKSFQKTAKDHRIQFRLVAAQDQVPLWYDQSLMDKVLFNLLSNAFKFTPNGGSIVVKIEEDRFQEVVRLEVEDTGHGMAPEHVAHIFDRFYQGEQYGTLGTGLGLSLSQEIVHLHQGQIGVQSELGKGTRFMITLKRGSAHFSEDEKVTAQPQYVPDESLAFTEGDEWKADQEVISAEPKEFTLLLVEDNLDLRRYLVQRFSPFYEVLEAENVDAGLTMAFDEVPDLIVCDLMLHGKSGYDIIRKLKSDVRSSHIPIIILSAKSTLEERIEGIRMGADDYITKPFNFALLSERVNTLLVNRQKLRDHYVLELPVEQHVAPASKIDKKFVNSFVAYVEQNIGNTQLGVNEICKELGLSRVQLYRKVKALIGMSVSDYITNVRMKKAGHLLLSEDLSISEIAYQVGFSSSTYFSTAFKNHFGMTPSEYKARQ